MHMSMHIMHIIHMCAIVRIVQHLTTYQSHLCAILVAMIKSCHSRISVCMCVHMHTYVYELVSPTTHESTFIMHHPVHMYTYRICVFFGHDVLMSPTLHQWLQHNLSLEPPWRHHTSTPWRQRAHLPAFARHWWRHNSRCWSQTLWRHYFRWWTHNCSRTNRR